MFEEAEDLEHIMLRLIIDEFDLAEIDATDWWGESERCWKTCVT